jgi:hypothetical protein
MSYSFLTQSWIAAKAPLVSIFKSTMPKLFGDDETESYSQIFLKNVFEAIHQLSCSYSALINTIFSGQSRYDDMIPDYLSWMAGSTSDLTKTDLAFDAYYNHYIGTLFYETVLKQSPNTIVLGNKITMSPSTTLQFAKGTYLLIKANTNYQWPSSVPDENYNLVAIDSNDSLTYFPIIQGLDQVVDGQYLNVSIQKPNYDVSNLSIVGLSHCDDIFYPTDSDLIGGYYYSENVEPVDQTDANNFIQDAGHPKLLSNKNVTISNFRTTVEITDGSKSFYIKPNWTGFNTDRIQIIRLVGDELVVIKNSVDLYSDQFDIINDQNVIIDYIEFDSTVIKTNNDRFGYSIGVNQGDFSMINDLPEFSIYHKNYLKGGLSQGVGITDSIKYCNNSWIGYDPCSIDLVGSLFVKEAD